MSKTRYAIYGDKHGTGESQILLGKTSSLKAARKRFGSKIRMIFTVKKAKVATIPVIRGNKRVYMKSASWKLGRRIL